MTSANIDKQDFLFELGCEELPPKALIKLAGSLHDQVSAAFKSLGLSFSDSEWLATPRRLAVRFNQLSVSQADQQIEKLGPAIAAAFDQDGNPKPAALGFAKSNGVDVDQLSRTSTDKGERLSYVAEVKGQSTLSLIPDVITKAVNQLPVPKAMRWGDNSFQFSRPVHWVLALLGEQTVDFSLFGKQASNISYGHRFHSPQAIELKTPSEYEEKLSKARVVVCFEDRKARIRNQVEAIASEINATAVVSEDLLEEVACLVEWPVALLGKFDTEFLQVPSEALISSMAEHQKYFHLVDQQGDLLANFITVSNIQSSQPESVVSGNEKVIRPRLADAKFFYDTDCKQSLESYVDRLKNIVFQNKLGTLYDKSQRIKKLATYVAKTLELDPTDAERAAEICKCDLMSDMVGEFADLQGIMGRYYASKDGEKPEVCAAMDEIYMPRFAGDQLPSTATGLILAISERMDTLVGIFGIGQIPTGAKDPFALRRAALGVVRLITEKQLKLDLSELIDQSILSYANIELAKEFKIQLLSFFAARTLAMLQDKGISSQVIKAVQALDITAPTDFLSRVNAVNQFNQSAESSDLAEANKRVKNILAKSDFSSSDQAIDQSLFGEEENQLFAKIEQVKGFVNTSVAEGNYNEALSKLAGLKDPVNLFFDKVMINADDPTVRNNRLALISELRDLFIGIADISLLQK